MLFRYTQTLPLGLSARMPATNPIMVSSQSIGFAALHTFFFSLQSKSTMAHLEKEGSQVPLVQQGL